MDNETREVVQRATRKILQNMAFMFGEPVDKDEVPAAQGEFLQAAMTFSGPVFGSFRMTMPASLACEVAASMLGIDTGDDAAARHRDDALCELTTVTCGHILAKIAGEGVLFHQSIPETVAVAPAEVSALEWDEETIALVVDESLVLVHLKSA